MPGAGEIEISIGPDGRVYLSVLTEELLEVAVAVCPEDESLARRLALARGLRAAREAKGRSDGSDKSDESGRLTQSARTVEAGDVAGTANP